MRSLTVIWLHASREDDARHLPVVEHGMSDAFRDFCADAFNVRMPLEYPPLKLTTVSSADALPDALFIDGAWSTTPCIPGPSAASCLRIG